MTICYLKVKCDTEAKANEAVTPGAVTHGLLAHVFTFITDQQSDCLLLEPSFQQSAFFLNTAKSKDFLTSFTHVLICRIHGLLGDSHPTVPTIGEGVEDNPCFVIACTIFPGFFFFFILLNCFFSQQIFFSRFYISATLSHLDSCNTSIF